MSYIQRAYAGRIIVRCTNVKIVVLCRNLSQIAHSVVVMQFECANVFLLADYRYILSEQHIDCSIQLVFILCNILMTVLLPMTGKTLLRLYIINSHNDLNALPLSRM